MSVSLLLAFEAAAVAQSHSEGTGLVRPKRLVHLFDFEERSLGNFEDLPMHWFVVGRPAQTSDPNFFRQPLHVELTRRGGFPAFTDVRFDAKERHTGEHSFLLTLNGGNAAAFLEVGTLAAVPTSDYLVSAMVRTDDLDRASARLVAYFLDAEGRVIEASRTASPRIGGTQDWSEATVRLSGDFAQAAWVGLELEVTQPMASADDPLGKQQVVLQDVHGSAWFDDISVWQLPHLDLVGNNRTGIVRSPEKPQFDIDVRDLTGRRLRAELRAYDHASRLVDSSQRPVGAGAPMTWRWTPRLPAFGWYLVDMTVHEDRPDSGVRGPVARSMTAMAWLPPTGDAGTIDGPDRYRFALSAEGTPDDELGNVPDVLATTGLQSVLLSAWGRETTLSTLDARQAVLDGVLRGVLGSGRLAALSLAPVPKALAEAPGVESQHPLGVLKGDRGVWLPYLAPIVMRQGQRVRQWQLGSSAEAEAFFDRDLAGLMSGIEGEFRLLAPKPQLFVPWQLNQQRRAELPEGVVAAVHVPTSATPETLGAHLAEWRTPPSLSWLHLDALPADEVDHPGRVADLALRMVAGWGSGAAGMTLARPWTTAADAPDRLLPDPLLAVYTNVAGLLAGRQVIGRLPLHEGMEAVVLDGSAGGMIVASRRGAPLEEAVLDLYLGERPMAIDVWGNRRELPLTDGTHRVEVGDSPTFITGIDAELAMFRASFHVEPAFIESRQKPHAREVVVRNPWSRTINGRLQFTGPAGWQVQPAQHTFSLSPGQTMRLPVTMTFPFAELAGEKRLTARFDFTADRHYEVELFAPLELGLKDLDFDATLALRPAASGAADAVDAEVLCVLTNNGDKPMSLSLFAQLPGMVRQDRIIGSLQPGQSIVRRMRFEGLGPDQRKSAIRAGARELNGPAALNVTLPFDGPP